MKEEKKTNQEAKYAMITGIIFKILDTIKPAIIIIASGYYANKIVGNLAGKETVANIVLSFFTDIKYTASIAVTAVSSFGWYRTEKKYKKTLERLTAENIELRIELDKARGSSMLSRDGKTHKRDMIL